MIKRAIVIAILIAAAVPAHADFRDVERRLRTQLGSPMRIPFLGVVRFAAWLVHPKGVYDFQLAVWEDHKSGSIDPVELENLFKRGLSSDFQPMVRVFERGGREVTFIYARAVGERFEMMVLNHDNSDTVLVRADIDAEKLARTIREPHSAFNMAGKSRRKHDWNPHYYD